MVAGGDTQRKIYRVAEITRRIKGVLETEFGRVWIEGELSNVRRPSSGHLYFTIKDESAQINAVMFRGQQRGMRFQPADGMQVLAQGDISVYERNGQYQVIVRAMEEGGQGILQARFEALKKQLAEEGLFDASRKQPLPLLPRRIGLVTSETGAAIRDMRNVIARRFPNVHLLLAPVRVQGEGAAQEIAEAIDLLNTHANVDVMIVGRGGGSLEDLWCFNEEVVARAIARSRVPVISAVGHEIDFTISDFVADVRTPTPSAAAELVVDRKDAFEERLAQVGRRLAVALRERLLEARARFATAAGSYVFREPANLLRQHRRQIETLRMQMRHAMEGPTRQQQQRVDDLSLRMQHRMERGTELRRHRLEQLRAQLRAMSPLAVLERGYSVTRNARGGIVRRAADVKSGERITTRVADGSIESEVTDSNDG